MNLANKLTQFGLKSFARYPSAVTQDWWRKRVVSLLVIGLMLSRDSWAAEAAVAPANKTTSRQEEAVISHLNAALAWYREVQGSNLWVLQPSDVFYRDNQRDFSRQVIGNAFDYAHSMVFLVGDSSSKTGPSQVDSRKMRLASRLSFNGQQLNNLKAQQEALSAKISSAPAEERSNLAMQEQILQSRINLESALGETLQKSIALFDGSPEDGAGAGLTARISALQVVVPEVFDPSGNGQVAKPAADTYVSMAPEGLVNRAAELFSLLRFQRGLDLLIKHTESLRADANVLSQPLATELRGQLKSGDAAIQENVDGSDVTKLEMLRDKIDYAAARFRNLSAALLPLREESVQLERSRRNLSEWRSSIVAQTDAILRVLFTRAIALLGALAVLFAISEGWKRATFRYVHDSRRRRQFLLVRRFATSALMVLVIIMGFVSDFSSLATFAGFITAGIAVALQTVILSVAAYFFLIGRFGVRVGDRVTVSGVTGEVIDIGLVRVFLMELAGTGVDLHSTGRVVVLANSALFSSNPVYKQLPGTDFAWHEIYVTIALETESGPIEKALLHAVTAIYGGYRTSIEEQHGALERLLDYKTEVPVPSAHIRLADAGAEVVIRYPAEIRKMWEIDEAVSKQVLQMLREDETLRRILLTAPKIRSAVKT